MIKIDEFREYLKFDKLALDDALKEQPSLLFEVSEAYEAAIAKRDELKDRLAVTEAQLDMDMREDFEAHKEKFTEGQIKSLIQRDPSRRDAYVRYVEAREQAGQLSALRDAFKERGYMLREMCSLFVSNYFEQASSRPTANTDATVYRTQRARLANNRQR